MKVAIKTTEAKFFMLCNKYNKFYSTVSTFSTALSVKKQMTRNTNTIQSLGQNNGESGRTNNKVTILSLLDKKMRQPVPVTSTVNFSTDSQQNTCLTDFSNQWTTFMVVTTAK